MGLDQWIRYIDDEEESQELIYRKVNWLRGWVIDNSTMTHESDCEPTTISREKLEELLEDIKYVQDNPDKAEDVLPILPGFFFGIYDYSSWYWSTLGEVRMDLIKILKNKKLKEVEYEDWW